MDAWHGFRETLLWLKAVSSESGTLVGRFDHNFAGRQYNMKHYIVPLLVSVFLALGLSFRLQDGDSTLGVIGISVVAVLALVVLGAIVKFSPKARGGMLLLVFFVQAQTLGNVLLASSPDRSNSHLYLLLVLSSLAWILILAIRGRENDSE